MRADELDPDTAAEVRRVNLEKYAGDWLIPGNQGGRPYASTSMTKDFTGPRAKHSHTNAKKCSARKNYRSKYASITASVNALHATAQSYSSSRIMST